MLLLTGAVLSIKTLRAETPNSVAITAKRASATSASGRKEESISKIGVGGGLRQARERDFRVGPKRRLDFKNRRWWRQSINDYQLGAMLPGEAHGYGKRLLGDARQIRRIKNQPCVRHR